MKRHGQLMEAIAEPANLRLAFWKAAKSKRAKADCRAFQERLEENVASLRAELLSGSVAVGEYHTFTIYDPKERTICAASFRERVLHHALMNVCEPVLERAAIFDSYACRKGRGQQVAVRRATGYARQNGWFLKMDIRKYFDSIDQEVLRGLLARKFKDAGVLEVFDRILATYQTAPGQGLPIGNLTSQHFANYYLAPLDRFIKEGLQCRSYVRYMDDFVVWGETAAELREVWRRVEDFLTTELKLELKSNVMLNRTERGMDFLGYRIFPRDLRLAKRSKRRFASKFRAYEREHREGVWSELELQQRMTALIAFTLPCRSRGFRRNVIERFGAEANGLQPRAARRQLEQQRQQRALCQPQQQQPGQRQQQQRLPGCPGPSSTRWPERRPADPAAVPSPDPMVRGEEQKQGPGVSSAEHSAKAPGLPFQETHDPTHP
jgi:retron-type reverse transcriptase